MNIETVKAIILSAGYGTRLQPLTETLPKALVPLVGRPLIRHTINRLLQAGISSIGINTHHHAALVQQLANLPRARVLVFWSAQACLLRSSADHQGQVQSPDRVHPPP